MKEKDPVTGRKKAATCIRLLGDGYAQIANMDESSGAFGVGIGYNTFREDGSFLVKRGSVGTITNDREAFASFVLSPATAAFSVSAMWRNHWKEIPDPYVTYLGFAGYADAGSTDWVVTDTSSTDTPAPEIRKRVTAFAVGAGPSIRLAPGWLRNNGVSFTLGLLGTTRILQGTTSGLRRGALGDETDFYYGGEARAELRINDVVVSATIPALFGGSVEGLTGARLLLAVGVRTGAVLD